MYDAYSTLFQFKIVKERSITGVPIDWFFIFEIGYNDINDRFDFSKGFKRFKYYLKFWNYRFVWQWRQ